MNMPETNATGTAAMASETGTKNAVRNRKMTPTEDDRLAGRRALDAAAKRGGHASWRALLALCSAKNKELLHIEFALECPFGLHEEYASSLRAAGLEMRAIGLFDIVVGRPATISSIAGVDIEVVRAMAIPVRDVGAAEGMAPSGDDMAS